MCYSDYWYVFWVKSGQEKKAAEEIIAMFNNKVVYQQLLVETFFRKQGKVTKETNLAFPGYIFIVTDIDNDEFVMRAKECIRKYRSIIKLLYYGDTNKAALHEEERALIEYLWQDKNCIEASIGFIKGDRIIVTDGPLIGRESVIKSIHPRRWQAVIELEFMGGKRRITVGLEIIKKLT